jgi:hypothetical protein
MAVVRLAGGLPPDLEVELFRETSGEAVAWAGRSSGIVEKIQGAAVMAAGAVFALVNLGGPFGVIGLLIDFIERGQWPSGGYAGLFWSLVGFAAGLFIARLGWRFFASARDVIWAVTDRRLVRIVAGGKLPTRSWGPAEIVGVERLNWDEPQRRGLAVTVRRRRGSGEMTLIIVGPGDLDAAERALLALTG